MLFFHKFNQRLDVYTFNLQKRDLNEQPQLTFYRAQHEIAISQENTKSEVQTLARPPSNTTALLPTMPFNPTKVASTLVALLSFTHNTPCRSRQTGPSQLK